MSPVSDQTSDPNDAAGRDALRTSVHPERRVQRRRRAPRRRPVLRRVLDDGGLRRPEGPRLGRSGRQPHPAPRPRPHRLQPRRPRRHLGRRHGAGGAARPRRAGRTGPSAGWSISVGRQRHRHRREPGPLPAQPRQHPRRGDDERHRGVLRRPDPEPRHRVEPAHRGVGRGPGRRLRPPRRRLRRLLQARWSATSSGSPTSTPRPTACTRDRRATASSPGWSSTTAGTTGCGSPDRAPSGLRLPHTRYNVFLRTRYNATGPTGTREGRGA